MRNRALKPDEEDLTRIMSSHQHSREEILSLMQNIPVAAIATSAGERPRIRMMHYATDESFNIYLATMKGDPKTVQMTNYPSVSLLIHKDGGDINESREVEITGKAFFVRDAREREQALAPTIFFGLKQAIGSR